MTFHPFPCIKNIIFVFPVKFPSFFIYTSSLNSLKPWRKVIFYTKMRFSQLNCGGVGVAGWEKKNLVGILKIHIFLWTVRSWWHKIYLKIRKAKKVIRHPSRPPPSPNFELNGTWDKMSQVPLRIWLNGICIILMQVPLNVPPDNNLLSSIYEP